MAELINGVSLESIMQNEYFAAAAIVVISFVVAWAINYILKNYVKRLTAKTATDLDDNLLKAVTKPIYLLSISVGLYFAVDKLTAVDPYSDVVNMIFLVLCVFAAAYLVARILSVFVTHALHVQKRFEKTPQLISKIVSVFVFLVAGLIIMGYYKIEITPLVATLGVGGIAVGLALQDTLSNFFAGLHILTDKPVNVGDVVEIENGTIRGTVEDISWRSTRIKTWNNNIVVVPNAKLAGSIMTNHSMPEQSHVFSVDCGVGYGSDLKHVEKTTLDVAKKVQQTVPGAVKNYEPSIMFKEFGDSNINFFVMLSSDKFGSKFPVRHEFIKALKERYDKEGIEISWPIRKVYYGKESGGRKKKK
ncbi:MAG: mechanosensitive ion channel family protein [Candidatus Aenigmatarchaeota archaeon]